MVKTFLPTAEAEKEAQLQAQALRTAVEDAVEEAEDVVGKLSRKANLTIPIGFYLAFGYENPSSGDEIPSYDPIAAARRFKKPDGTVDNHALKEAIDLALLSFIRGIPPGALELLNTAAIKGSNPALVQEIESLKLSYLAARADAEAELVPPQKQQQQQQQQQQLNGVALAIKALVDGKAGGDGPANLTDSQALKNLQAFVKANGGSLDLGLQAFLMTGAEAPTSWQQR